MCQLSSHSFVTNGRVIPACVDCIGRCIALQQEHCTVWQCAWTCFMWEAFHYSKYCCNMGHLHCEAWWCIGEALPVANLYIFYSCLSKAQCHHSAQPVKNNKIFSQRIGQLDVAEDIQAADQWNWTHRIKMWKLLTMSRISNLKQCNGSLITIIAMHSTYIY